MSTAVWVELFVARAAKTVTQHQYIQFTVGQAAELMGCCSATARKHLKKAVDEKLVSYEGATGNGAVRRMWFGVSV